MLDNTLDFPGVAFSSACHGTMNKDALLATLIGFGIGLLITGMLLVGPSLAKGLPKFSLPTISLPKPKPPQAKTSPTPTPATFQLTIDSPLADAIEQKAEALVSGKTSPGATVVVAGPLDETVVVVKEDGTYAGKVKLTEGKNEIVVTSYLKTEVKALTVTVYYTPEKL